MMAVMLAGKDRIFRYLYPPPAKDGCHVSIVGTVYRVEEKEQYQKIYLKNLINLKDQKDPTDPSGGQSLRLSRILIRDRNKRMIFPGERIRVSGEVFMFRRPGNPGEFDEEAYYLTQGICAGIWGEKIEGSTVKPGGLVKRLYLVRRRWSQNLVDVLGEKEGRVLAAMLLGEKALLEPETRRLYTTGGIGHVLAISGLHLTFVGWSIYRLLRRATGSFLIGAVGGAALLGIYIAMIGLSVSALRAAVMLLFRTGAELFGRRYDTPTALAFSAVVVVLWQPGSVFTGAFWLSFGAVASLMLVYPVFTEEEKPDSRKKKEKRRVRVFEKLRQGIGAGICINSALLPVQLYLFYVYPTYSILLNIWVVPLMGLVLALGMSGSLLYLIPVCTGAGIAVTQLPLCLSGGILWLYEWACKAVTYIPGMRYVAGRPEKWQIGAYYVVYAGIVILWRIVKKRPLSVVKKMGVISAGMLLWMSAFLLLGYRTDAGTFRFVMLDVGQGDGLFIKTPSGTTILIDGGSSSKKNVGSFCIEPFLLSQGIQTVDYVFLTHGDSDHCNGVQELLKDPLSSVQIRNLVLSGQAMQDEQLKKIALSAADRGVLIQAVKKGDRIREKGFLLECIYPEEGEEVGTGNAGSVVFSISYDAFRFLLTGDLEGEGEEKVTGILEERKKNWSVLKVSHHGSRNSTSESFLGTVSPRVALISAGKNNRYGHPHAETLERLKKQNTSVFQTADEGAVIIEIKNNKMSVRSYRGGH